MLSYSDLPHLIEFDWQRGILLNIGYMSNHLPIKDRIFCQNLDPGQCDQRKIAKCP